jgi:hypothetical protein
MPVSVGMRGVRKKKQVGVASPSSGVKRRGTILAVDAARYASQARDELGWLEAHAHLIALVPRPSQ